jgi:hypothetical protein
MSFMAAKAVAKRRGRRMSMVWWCGGVVVWRERAS